MASRSTSGHSRSILVLVDRQPVSSLCPIFHSTQYLIVSAPPTSETDVSLTGSFARRTDADSAESRGPSAASRVAASHPSFLDKTHASTDSAICKALRCDRQATSLGNGRRHGNPGLARARNGTIRLLRTTSTSDTGLRLAATWPETSLHRQTTLLRPCFLPNCSGIPVAAADGMTRHDRCAGYWRRQGPRQAIKDGAARRRIYDASGC